MTWQAMSANGVMTLKRDTLLTTKQIRQALNTSMGVVESPEEADGTVIQEIAVFTIEAVQVLFVENTSGVFVFAGTEVLHLAGIVVNTGLLFRNPTTKNSTVLGRKPGTS